MKPDDHYVVITADSHAGGSHAQYREYLDPQYRDDFDAWRGKYSNPFKDLKDTDLRLRNWDSELRDQQQNDDGVVGEVIFPNTVPPFFPSFVLFAPPPPPEEYELRHAGVQAHNRWLADYCAEKPEARAGIGQIFLNDLDDAIADVRWCKEHGLRGGVLVGSPPVTCDWLKPLHDSHYDPLWAACSELGVPVNAHSGTGARRRRAVDSRNGADVHRRLRFLSQQHRRESRSDRVFRTGHSGERTGARAHRVPPSTPR